MLLNRLKEDLQDLKSDEVLAAWKPVAEQLSSDLVSESFVRNDLVDCEIVSATVDDQFKIRIESTLTRGEIHFLAFPWKYYSPFLDVMSDDSEIRNSDFQHVEELISELVRLGVLRPL
jgi:hypothetical protein